MKKTILINKIILIIVISLTILLVADVMIVLGRLAGIAEGKQVSPAPIWDYQIIMLFGYRK